MEAWGFTFTTAGSWEKRTVNNKMQWGPGYRLRSTNEPYLIGKIGIEKYYEDLLHGKPGYQYVETDAHGQILRQLGVRLTIAHVGRRLFRRPSNRQSD